MSQFDFLQFLTDMNRETDIHKSFDIFAKACRSVGLDRLVYSLITPHDTIGYEAGHAIVGNYPDEWMCYYRQNGYEKIDPVIKHIKNTEGIFQWNHLKDFGLLRDKKERKLMDEAHEIGLYAGLGLSLTNQHDEIVGMGFASSDNHMVLSKPIQDFIMIIAKQFDLNFKSIARRQKNIECVENHIVLTPTQKEVLLWVSRDKKYGEIADIMMISENTVKFHMKEIFKRFHVNSQISAVLKAVRLGIIVP